MVDFLLSRSSYFYLWTGMLLALLNVVNFEIAYTEVDYMQNLFPVVSAILFLLSGALALFYFWSQSRNNNKVESGWLEGIVKLVMLFNLAYNLLFIKTLL